jgi:hypothetical protein
MDLRSVVKVLLRHLLVVAIGLALTVALALRGGQSVTPSFEAKASLLFVSPSSTWDAEGRPISVNPFARVGMAEQLAASTVLSITRTQDWKERMVARGATGTFVYTRVAEMVMELRTTAATPELAMHTRDVGAALAEEELLNRQQVVGAPPGTLITINRLPTGDAASELLGSKIKVMFALGVVGAGASATAAFVADAFLPRAVIRRTLRWAFRGVLRRVRRKATPTPRHSADRGGATLLFPVRSELDAVVLRAVPTDGRRRAAAHRR